MFGNKFICDVKWYEEELAPCEYIDKILFAGMIHRSRDLKFAVAKRERPDSSR